MATDWKAGKRCFGSQGKNASQKTEGSIMAVAERAIKARLAGKGYAAIVREAEGLDRKKPKKETKKEKEKRESRLRRLARLMKMAALGRHYRTPEEELPPAARRRG